MTQNIIQLVRNNSVLPVYLLVSSAALILRFWGLDNLPLALYRDESWNGVEGLITSNEWDFKAFYDGSTGREGLLIWLIALTHLFVEPSAFAVRFANAFVGTLSVVALPFLLRPILNFFYFLGHKQDPDHRQNQIFWVLSLAAMFFLATSYWHLTFSRITFRAILDPLFCLASCSFVVLSYRHPQHFWLAALTGVVCGLGLYGYGAVKFIALPLLSLFMCAAYLYKTKIILPTIIIFVFTCLTVYPLAAYIFEHSDTYFLRLNQVSIFRKDEPIKEFIDSFMSMLGMLGGLGDGNLRHNHNANAQMNTVFFASFISGLMYVFVLLIKSDKEYRWLKFLGMFSLLWLLVMLIPSALTYEGQPHSLRSIGLLIPLVIFAGIGVSVVFSLMGDTLIYSRKFQLAIAAIALSLLYETSSSYFHRYAQYPGVKNWFDYSVNQAAISIRDDDSNQRYLVVVANKHDPERHSVIQTFRYLTNLKLDSATKNNIIRLRELANHPDRDQAIVYVPNGLKHAAQRIVGDRNRVRVY